MAGAGKTHRAYIWSYSSTQFDDVRAIVYDFADSRAAVHPKQFLQGWSGKLVCDDYSGYKGLFADGVTEGAAWRTREGHSAICGSGSRAAPRPNVLSNASLAPLRELVALSSAAAGGPRAYDHMASSRTVRPVMRLRNADSQRSAASGDRRNQ